MQGGTYNLRPQMSCNVAVMCRIPPPNSSPSFEVSAIFALREIDNIFAYGKGCQ